MHRASLARCSGFRCALATLMLVLPLYGAGRAWAALVPSAPVGSALPLASTVVNSLPRYGEYVHVDELPEILTQVPPVYPEAARRAGVEGYVQVRVLVGRDGLVKDIRVERSIPALDSAAVAAVERWRFKPAVNKGRAVAVWVGIPVSFALPKEATPPGEAPSPGERATWNRLSKSPWWGPLPTWLEAWPESLRILLFSGPSGDSSWRQFDAGRVFSFRAPPQTREIPVRGIDSFVGEYVAPGMLISFDYGMYTGRANTGSPIQVSGLPGMLAFGEDSQTDALPYFAHLYVTVHEAEPSQALGIDIRCRSEREQASALRILRSVVIHDGAW